MDSAAPITRALDAVEAAIAGIDPQLRPLDNFEPLRTLLRAVLDLGTTLGGDDEAREDRRVGSRLRAQGASLQAMRPLLDYFTARIEARLCGTEATGVRWVELCHGRSGLEYLLELYRGTALTDGDEPLEVQEFEDIDANLKQMQAQWGGVPEARIPPGIPESHWWWR